MLAARLAAAAALLVPCMCAWAPAASVPRTRRGRDGVFIPLSGQARAAAAGARRRVAAGQLVCVLDGASPGTTRASAATSTAEPPGGPKEARGSGEPPLMTPVRLSPWVALRGALSSSSFYDFMSYVRREQGDAVILDLWPVLPPTYVLMGKAANRNVLSKLDPSLEQILQELINVLPVSARIPSEVDVDLQRKVAQLFSNAGVVNERLPSFLSSAHAMRDRWGAQQPPPPPSQAAEQQQQQWWRRRPQQATPTQTPAQAHHAPQNGEEPSPRLGMPVFLELSEYVLRADLEVLYGRTFCEAHATQLVSRFAEWVENIANGQLIGFFDDLGSLLTETIADMKQRPERYAGERSVLQVYLESGALDRHDDESLVGLLSMTLMAAVFNTQVSLAWILVHLYSEPELLERARAEIATCPDLSDYAQLQELEFVNSCIDEAVRLHTMLPGNTVLRKTRSDIQYGGLTIPSGSVLWLYPNAVHQDEQYFPQPQKFCPMRLLNGNLEKLTDEFELVTFGHGQKRCIGEKMARAMICAFLGTVLPTLDAEAPEDLPADGFFDLIPASELRLYNTRFRSPGEEQ